MGTGKRQQHGASMAQGPRGHSKKQSMNVSNLVRERVWYVRERLRGRGLMHVHVHVQAGLVKLAQDASMSSCCIFKQRCRLSIESS